MIITVTSVEWTCLELEWPPAYYVAMSYGDIFVHSLAFLLSPIQPSTITM